MSLWVPRAIAMLRSIRSQILIPILVIQALAITVIALSTAYLAAQRGERQIVDRLSGMDASLSDASFPFTASVLERMRGLSGAHFVAYGDDGKVAATTLPDAAETPLQRTLDQERGRLESLGDSPTIELRGTSYLAVPMRSAASTRDARLWVLYPESSWRAAQWEAALPSLLLGLGSLGMMALATTWIAHRISSRLKRVRHQVAAIAEGHFQEIPLGRDSDEVHALSNSINRMCAELSEMRHTIEQCVRTRVLAQLAAGLAHQLRNSLTGARMSIQLHAKRFPAQNDESLDVALRQLVMTEEQVRGLLSLGRLERCPPEPCDIVKLIGEVASLVGPSCEHAKVALRLEPAADALVLQADPASLRAAVLNLTLNAIEAAGPGGVVHLGARRWNGAYQIEVRDTGAGPPPELAESLFDPFVTSKPEGVGLGLALARQVAADHGGRLGFARTNEETCFHLIIPQPNGTPRATQ